MNFFKNPFLNHILNLFEYQIHHPRFEQQLIDCLLACDEQTLMLRSKDGGNILAVLCQRPIYYLKPGFEKAFIFLMNNIILRSHVFNKNMFNIDLLMNGRNPNSIFMLLLNSKQYQAARICLGHLTSLSGQIPAIKDIILSQLFQKDDLGKFQLSTLYRHLNGKQFRELSAILINTYLSFDINKELMLTWLLSTVNLSHLNLLAEIVISTKLSLIQKQGFLELVVLFCDFEIIQKAQLMCILHPTERRLGLMDFTLTQDKLDIASFHTVLDFYSKLFRHHRLSKDEYHELILCHPRPGFSPMHQLILQGHYLGLSAYLDYLEKLLPQEIITNQQIKDAFLKTNTKGFSCLYQAMNSFHEDIPALFLKHLMLHFSKQEVFTLLTHGTYNPYYERHFRPRCADDKAHARATNQMLSNIRRSLKEELNHTNRQASPTTVGSFFSPASASTSPIPSDEIIGLEFEKLGII